MTGGTGGWGGGGLGQHNPHTSSTPKVPASTGALRVRVAPTERLIGTQALLIIRTERSCDRNGCCGKGEKENEWGGEKLREGKVK